MKPIYKPKGAAAEYADYALNIYTGCTNGCTYCYAPAILRKTREAFAQDVTMRPGLIEALEKQLTSGAYKGKTVHLCFTCDPYPTGVDTFPTREVILRLKNAGCHIQILSKNPMYSMRDWELLDSEDWLGTTFTGVFSGHGYELNCSRPSDRPMWLKLAKKRGIRTWLSCEPVLDPYSILDLIAKADYVDEFKFGKLTHGKSNINWKRFGREVEKWCRRYKRNYLIKQSLREVMET